MLCRHKNGKSQGFALSKEHNPTNYEERKRIEKCGGHVRLKYCSFLVIYFICMMRFTVISKF